ncbi:MAG: hypothetical protein JO062_11005 [Bryobacterales bacterium]|nr:hypothetical protein [Bryobacterales bacterium]
MNGPYNYLDGVRVTNIGPLNVYTHPYVAKIRPDGSRLVWFTMFGGSGPGGEGNRGRCTVDSAGAVYAQGETTSKNFPVTPGAYQTSTNLPFSGWVAKLYPNGSGLEWATYVASPNGSADAADSGIVLAPDGSIYFGGFTRGAYGLATPGAYQRFNATGRQVCYIGHLAGDGKTMLALTYLGPTTTTANMTECENIVLDSGGNVYTYGLTPSASFPVTPGAYQRVYGGGIHDLFVSKLNPSLSTLIASTFIGGSGAESADTSGRIHIDAAGNVWAAASSNSTNFPVTLNAFRRTLSGADDMVFFALNPSLTALVYGSYIGGDGADGNRSMWIY